MATMRSILFLVGLIVLPAHAGALFKCVNAAGEATYSNLPCGKFPGMKEVKTIEADPGPPVSDLPISVSKKKTPDEDGIKEPKKSARERAETRRVLKAERAEKNKCDKISDQISDVMDKMDVARRKGYTIKQENEWNDKIRELNARKNRMNCF
jgi:hypothetical protein